MKVFVFLFVALLFFSCGSEYSHNYTEENVNAELVKHNYRPIILSQGNITLTEVIDIPPFEDVSLELMQRNVKFRQGANKLEFSINKFILGEKTASEKETGLVRESNGQYLVAVGKTGEKKFSKQFEHQLIRGDNHLLTFMCRSYGISVKSPKSFAFYNIKTDTLDGEVIQNKKSPFLYLNSPEQKQRLSISEPVLLDFYLVNFNIQKQGSYLKLRIDSEEFKLYKWTAFSIQGLTVGEHNISLEAFDREGKAIEGKLLSEVGTKIKITEGFVFN
jgi:hypothetical protein